MAEAGSQGSALDASVGKLGVTFTTHSPTPSIAPAAASACARAVRCSVALTRTW